MPAGAAGRRWWQLPRRQLPSQTRPELLYEAVTALADAGSAEQFKAVFAAWPILATDAATHWLTALSQTAKKLRNHVLVLIYQQRIEFLTRAAEVGPDLAAEEQFSRSAFAQKRAATAFYATNRADVEHLILTAFPAMPEVDVQGDDDVRALIQEKVELIVWSRAEGVDQTRPLINDRAEVISHDLRWRHAAFLAWEMGAHDGATDVEGAGAFALSTAALLLMPDDADQESALKLLELRAKVVTDLYYDAPDDGLGALDWIVFSAEALLREKLTLSARATALLGLSGALLERHRRRGRAEDLVYGREVGDAASGLLTDMAEGLVFEFRRTKRTEDIDNAITLYEMAVSVIATDSPLRAAWLSNLGNALRERYDLTRQDEDIARAIEVGQEAVALLSPEDPVLPGSLSNLCLAFLARYIRTGQSSDIDTAIEWGHAALDVTGPHDPDRAKYSSNLAQSYMARVGMVAPDHVLDELAGALRELQRAAEQAGSTREVRDTQLILGRMLGLRPQRDHDIAHAIALYDEAVAVAPADDPDRAAYLANRSVALTMWSVRSRQAPGVGESITGYQAALAELAPDDPRRAGILFNLAKQSGTAALLTYVKEATNLATAPLGVRLRAAQAWAHEALADGDFDEATEAYGIAVGLLAQLAWRGRDRDRQESELIARPGLASDAAAVAVLAGQPERAIELLEQGRSVLWGQLLHLRGDLSRLAERSPDLARALERVHTTMDRPFTDPLTAGERLRALDEWNELLAEVRAMPDFEHFLLPVPFADMDIAVDGPVVMVNISEYGSHALIVSAEQGVRVLTLPDLDAAEASRRADVFKDNLRRATNASTKRRTLLDREQDRHELLGVLDWLWTTVAAPILDELGYTDVPADGEHPRVWWCPTGPLTVLPLHAAGRHTRTAARPTILADTVSGRVVSSYTPSLTALSSERAQRTGQGGHLVVGVARAPDMPPLPSVPAELKVLERHLPSATYLVDNRATRANLRAAIGACSWIHLACHASQHHDDPVRSAFSLWDGHVTIAELTTLRDVGGRLAYLSACQTATGATHLANEAIHLAGALLVLGYRQVIATMWTVYDNLAPTMADIVYGHIFQASTVHPPAAIALHAAVESLRVAHPADPFLWAPYIHTGQ